MGEAQKLSDRVRNIRKTGDKLLKQSEYDDLPVLDERSFWVGNGGQESIGEAVGTSDRLRGRRDGMEYQLFRKAYGEKGTSETWLVS